MEQLASDTSSFEGGPPFSAEPHGWGISMSVSGEFQRARSRSPPWTESGPRGPRRLPRTRWRRTHQLALPHLRRRGLRAADEYALLGAQRASHGAPFHATKLSHLAPHGWRAESCVELCPQTVIGSQLLPSRRRPTSG